MSAVGECDGGWRSYFEIKSTAVICCILRSGVLLAFAGCCKRENVIDAHNGDRIVLRV